MRAVAAAAALLYCFAVGSASAHGGGLNAEGCHHDRKNGGHHCHRAPAVPPPEAPTKSAALAEQAPAPGQRTPTCHVGPRGGMHTITPSGRKNYSGC